MFVFGRSQTLYTNIEPNIAEPCINTIRLKDSFNLFRLWKNSIPGSLRFEAYCWCEPNPIQ